MLIFVYFFTQTDPARTVQRCAFCRSRRELSNAYLVAKFGFDTAENEPSKVCRIAPSDRDPRAPGADADPAALAAAQHARFATSGIIP